MILNIPYICKLVVANYKLRQCRINNLTSIIAFSYFHIIVHVFKKNKVCIIHKDTPFSDKLPNVHGNVIQIANLLTSIEAKKLLIQVNYFIYHINHRSYQHSQSREHLRSL